MGIDIQNYGNIKISREYENTLRNIIGLQNNKDFKRLFAPLKQPILFRDSVQENNMKTKHNFHYDRDRYILSSETIDNALHTYFRNMQIEANVTKDDLFIYVEVEEEKRYNDLDELALRLISPLFHKESFFITYVIDFDERIIRIKNDEDIPRLTHRINQIREEFIADNTIHILEENLESLFKSFKGYKLDIIDFYEVPELSLEGIIFTEFEDTKLLEYATAFDLSDINKLLSKINLYASFSGIKLGYK